ncbi:hypothetical protein Spaf_1162 [Streptococcus parasanguinis FW213]|uniref:Uncharacterized protein n=1 Tax=Streptococcus parasanguinis FW213 TaxID=1114965 RepID=I1ZM74_STRPA|nr:hypothetical protein Spaf_1162 [Streptococcus parasanguinis FW213]
MQSITKTIILYLSKLSTFFIIFCHFLSKDTKVYKKEWE